MKEFSEKYTAFLHEYEALLKDVLGDQNQIFNAVIHGDLEELRHTMAAAQANTMRMDKMEARRSALQEEAGFTGFSIRQVAHALPAEEGAALLSLCTRIDATVTDIRFIGEKSIGMAQCNLAEVDPSLLEETLVHTGPNAKDNPYQKMRRDAAQAPTIKTKA